MCVICVLLHIVYVRNICYYNYNSKTKSRRNATNNPTAPNKKTLKGYPNYNTGKGAKQ